MRETQTTGLPQACERTDSIGALIAQLRVRGVQLWFEGDRLRFRAPKGALDAASHAALGKHKDEVVAALRAAAASEETLIPATAGQQMHWFNRQADPDSAAYNVGQAVRISSPVDVAALRSALQVVVDRHAALRSTFAWDDQGPIQKVAGWKPVAFQQRELRGADEEELRRAVAAAAREPFDLSTGPVFRATLHTRADDDHVLTIIGHHIVFDGGSIFKVLKELRALYAEATGQEQAKLPRAGGDPAAFASWHRALLAGPDGARMEAYWAEALASLGEQVVLPGDRPRGSAPVDQDLVRAAATSELVEAVRRASAARSVTPFVLYLAAYQAVLHRWTGADDVIVGTPAFFGRADPRFTDAVGDFVNILPLRLRLTKAITLGEIVAQARLALYGALEAQALPFTRILEIVQPARVGGRAPLVSATLTLQRFDELRELQGLFAPAESEPPFDFAGLSMSIYPLNWLPNAFDLQLQLMQVGDAVQFYWGFDAALFDRATVEQFSSDYFNVLSVIAYAPETPVAELKTSRVAAALAGAALLERLAKRDIHCSIDGVELRVNIPEVALDDATKAEMSANRNALMVALRLRAEREVERGGIPALPADRAPELSFAQRRLWFLDQMDPRSVRYNIGGGTRLIGEIDASVLRSALEDVFARHEAFRTRISTEHGAPKIEVLARSHVSIEILDLSSTPEDQRQAVARETTESLIGAPLDLANGIVARARIVRFARDDHVLVLSMHHIVSDGWSLSIINRDVRLAYDARLAGSALSAMPPKVRYVDFAAWEQNRATANRFAESQAFWRRALAGAPALIDLPCDRARLPGGSVRGARTRGYFDEALIARLEGTARARGCTLFIALLAIWQALLSRLSGQEDVVVGTTVANRENVALEEVVGFLANNVPLRGDLTGSPSFADHLARTKLAVLNAFEHSGLPFDAIVEAVNPERTLAHAPVFQTLLTLSNFPMEATGPGGTAFAPIDLDVHAARFDLTVDLARLPSGPRAGQMIAVYEYSADLFNESTVLRWHAQFKLLLEAACAAPDRPLAEVPLMLSTEARAFYAKRNDTSLEYDRSLATHALLDAAARSHPEQVAIVGPDGKLTYAEFESRTNQLANLLVARGVKPGSRVAVCLERSVDLPLALAGVWKAGAAFVPLDPAYPSQRLGYVLEDAEVACVVTTSAFFSLLDGVSVPLVLLDVDDKAIDAAPNALPSLHVAPEDLAYVIYTSGSTGRPKGVEIEHRNLVAFLAAMRQTPGLRAGETLLAVTTPSFDIAGLELWLPLSVGARVVIASRQDTLDGKRLARLLQEHAVSMLQATPATWRLMLESGWEGKADLTALCGGEAMPLDLARSLTPRVAALWNMYGPTETTIWSAIYRVKGDEGAIPIGGPIANTRIYVLDAFGTPSAIGAPGELVITGEGVARGYRNRPELNAEKFVKVAPLATSERAFRTGDLARWRADGELDFLGRADGQVKIRGFRVELGEIEARLAALPAVASAVVAAREDAPGEKRLVAYVVTALGTEFDEAATRAALRKTLPDYMAPSAYVQLSRLPLSPNGKVDRKALPAPSGSVGGALDAADALMTPMQRNVAALWREILRLDRVGLNQNFFDLGGHSLLLVKLQASLKASFGQEITIVELFQLTTVAAQAERLAGPAGGSEAISLLLQELESKDIRLQLDGGKLRLNAPKGAVNDQLKKMIASNREFLIARLQSEAKVNGAGSLSRVPRDGRLPVTFAQQRLWFLDQLDRGRSHYNIFVAIKIEGRLDITALERGLVTLSRRHETLRTRIGEQDGAPWVEIDEHLVPPLVRHDVGDLLPAKRHQHVCDLVLSFGQEPFDLARGPLARHMLVALGADEYVFAMAMHHIVSDGWSTSILVRELMELYAAYVDGREPDLPIPAQYVDYAGWEQRLAAEGSFAHSLDFWERKLEGAPALIELPTDCPRPTTQSFRGQRMLRGISGELVTSLKDLARREGSTLFVVLLSAWQVLLHRYSGQDDILVGSAAANRSMPELESIVGCLANTIVLRGRMDGNPSFKTYMESATASVFDALDHQALPFDHLVEALNPARSTSHSPIFQVFFTLMSFPMAQVSISGLRLSPFEAFTKVARFDLGLDAVEYEGELRIYYEFATDLYQEATIDRLHDHYQRLLGVIACAPDTRIDEIDFVGPEERLQLVERFNDNSVHHDRRRTVHSLFEKSVQERPGSVAAQDERETLTYEALDLRANALSHFLIQLGVGRGALVAVCIDRTVDVPVALAAVLKAGAAYVPLDPSHPRERLYATLDDANVTAVVTLDRYCELFEGCGAPLVRLDGDASCIEAMPSIPPCVVVEPSDLAYVIYTSGSTGRPKGVEVEHRNVVAFIEAMQREPGLAAGDVLLAVTTLSFDIAGLELWLPLSVGARVVLATRADALDGERLAALIEEHAVTLLQATPATWRILLDTSWSGRPQLKALVGGEAMPRDLASFLVDRVGELWNMYGPTETTIWSTLTRVVDPSKAITIGRPIANTQCYVLTPDHAVCPIGVAGELCIGGEGVTRGYRNRPDLTADRFVNVALQDGRMERIYKTGDVARVRADGTLEYLGRRDTQVKIRGYRIELGEVEAALVSLSGVKEAVAAAREERKGDSRLVGYVTMHQGITFDEDAARTAMRSKLPEYMVPNAFAVLDALPLTPNGKVDRKALPRPTVDRSPRASTAETVMTPPQRRVAGLWCEMLHVDSVGLHDNFFDIGGHSLLLVKLHAALKREFTTDVALVELFQHTTVYAQARRMARQRSAEGALARASQRAMLQVGHSTT